MTMQLKNIAGPPDFIAEWRNVADDAMKRAFKLDADYSNYLFPRRTPPPHGYLNTSVFSFLMGGEFAADRMGYSNDVDRVLIAAGVKLFNMGCPTYFVAPEFVEAVNHTKPPVEGTLDDMVWPLDAALFVLPLDFSYRTFGTYVPFIAFSLVSGGKLDCQPGLVRPIEVSERIAVSFYCTMNAGVPVFYHRHAPMDGAVSQFVMDDEIAMGAALANTARLTHTSVADERGLMLKLNTFVIKLLLVMAAEPSLVEHGAMTRKPREKHGRKIDALWSPNFLGRAYRSSVNGDGSHASPRLHWRRGHLHRVCHGPGRMLRRMQWFKPVLVNAENT